MSNQIAKEIGRALLEGTPQARALAIARATCNAVAVSQMACERCGAVHDQERVIVIEQGEDPEQLTALGACCPKCWQESYAVRMKAAVSKGDAKLWKTTWKGTQPITTAEDDTLKTLHTPYTIAQIIAHYVERQKKPNTAKASDAHQLHAASRIATDCSIMILDPSAKTYTPPRNSEPRFTDGRLERISREILETPFSKRRKIQPTETVTVEDFGSPSYGVKDEDDNRHACRHFFDGSKIDERYFQTVLKTWGKQLQTWQSLKDATIPRVFAIDRDGRTVACIACISAD